MSHLKYFDYPNFGTRSRKEVGYSQAVRYGDIVEISGQGGWNRLTEEISKDIAEEVSQTFENVDHSLKIAGAEKGWEQVVAIRVYALPDHFMAVGGEVIANLKKWCPTPGHEPLMTFVGAACLYGDMKIEIEAKAHIGDASK